MLPSKFELEKGGRKAGDGRNGMSEMLCQKGETEGLADDLAPGLVPPFGYHAWYWILTFWRCLPSHQFFMFWAWYQTWYHPWHQVWYHLLGLVPEIWWYWTLTFWSWIEACLPIISLCFGLVRDLGTRSGTTFWA